MARCFW